MTDEAGLARAAGQAVEAVSRLLRRASRDLHLVEVGMVTRVTSGVARVDGLPGVEADELIQFPGGLLGIAGSLDRGGIGVILLGTDDALAAGVEARRTGRVVDVPVGPALLGRVVDALGRPLDEQGPIGSRERRPVERRAPAILQRAPVSVPLQTGLKAVDALVPIGRGQRQLILGDRQTGKTAIAVDTILNQRETDIVSVYCAIGQRGSSVARVIADLRTHGALDRSVVVVAGGEEPPGLQFVAPYAATSIAEYFMEQGRDVLIVYDDLTRHARAHRELSLLLRRPPGREAYPGDIFYIHSRLLERATRLRREHGGGSLTALPIVETEAQNLSAYIPTNLISITDGQIYLSPDLFQKGVLPAVDVGLSVSRVGGKAQLPAYRAIAGRLRLAYAQFEELEAFSRFGTRLDAQTRRLLERGRRVREVLKQPQYQTLAVGDQLAVLLAAAEGVLDAVPLEAVGRAERLVREAVRRELAELCARVEGGAPLAEAGRGQLLGVARAALAVGGLLVPAEASRADA